MRPRIYVYTLPTRDSGFPLAAATLLDEMRSDCDLYVSTEWRPYEQIEAEIDGCDALIALVDKGWSTSTWKAHEVWWACHGCGTGLKLDHRNVPTFLYVIDDLPPARYLDNLEGVIWLPDDPVVAAGRVLRDLPIS